MGITTSRATLGSAALAGYIAATEITDLATLESLPVGATVIDSAGDAWQRTNNDRWDGTRGRISVTRRIASAYSPLLLVWLPPEVTR